MKCINGDIFDAARLKKLNDEFNAAAPYRHVVIEGILKLDVADRIFANFPPKNQLNKHYSGLNENKSEGSNFEDFHKEFAFLKEDLSSPEFCKIVEQISGIKDVFVTDDNLGTGVHQGSNGSFLDVHIDFNIHPRKNVHRRLNLLIYLNKHWKPEYGGELEMWDANMTKCEKKVLPMFNRCVIFETSEISYHGYSKINIPEGESRKSFYSYYYTKEREGASHKYHDTVFKAKPEDSTMKKVGTSVKENLKNFTKRQLKKVGINI
jgi:Rps23 Pro-64 3,4-dihydroxylase Tpa1-like proline 4-hydroxylase